MVRRIAHVGIATESVEKAAEFYRCLGLEVSAIEVREDHKVKVAFLRIGESEIELLEPTEEDSTIARFIRKRGEGIHHIALEVDDIEGQLENLESHNVQLVGSGSQMGAQGRKVAFVHPSSTGGVLVELCQARKKDRQ